MPSYYWSEFMQENLERYNDAKSIGISLYLLREQQIITKFSAPCCDKNDFLCRGFFFPRSQNPAAVKNCNLDQLV